ncbi:hypothetical protein CsSME_00013179 [Camellia sinensis var. sinensis]
MESMRVELEVLHEERQRDHEELLKEKEERQRDREEIIREREELMKQAEEEKKNTRGTTSTTQSSERRGITTHNLLAVFRWSSYYSVLRHNVSRLCSRRLGVSIHYAKDFILISIR